MSLEQLFSTSELNVLVPDTTLEFPSGTTADEWLSRAKFSKIERKQAFFDEQLLSLLMLRIKPPTPSVPSDPKNPPELLLEFLSHLQVSLEATYISSVPQPGPNDTPRTPASRLSAPPRTSSLGPPKPGHRYSAHHPSILPPSTPHPMPSTGEQDRKYVSSEGTLLLANIWGANTADDSPETFSLLWSEEEEVWVAVYRLSLTVSFLRLNFSNPLLCLTVSATLRDKRIINNEKHPLAKYLATLGLKPPESPTTPTRETPPESEENLLDGLEEVNLLAGLAAGPTFARADPPLNLPSIRLGQVTRQKLFSLPPILMDTPAPSPSPMTAVRKSLPTLRKSYRRTLQTVSGFRVRMRTVFVPYVLLPETEGTLAELDDAEKERERREAGSAERTVVLCVEIENSGESGIGAGFVVEKVDVKIGGEGAKATLIGWGNGGFSSDAAKKTFPLRIGPLAQYNLLYAVSFLRSPEEMDAFSFARAAGVGVPPQSDLQRAVTINIFGKPYIPPRPSTDTSPLLYPTNTFSSRWNCVLDLAAHQAQALDAMDVSDPAGGHPSILPEPASPFPIFAANSASSSRTHYTGSGTPTYTAGSTPQASSRRSTLTPGGYFAGRSIKGLTPNRSAMFLHPGFTISPLNSGRFSTSSVPISGSGHRFPTTYSAPPPPPPPHTPGIPPSSAGTEPEEHLGPPFDAQTTPQTPAYPAFPHKSTIPPSPMSLGPIASQTQANVGPSVEIRRERGAAAGEIPRTPGPYVPSAFGEQRMLNKLQSAAAGGENIVVSVGLLPLEVGGDGNGNGKRSSVVGSVLGPGKIYPLDVFTLDIFVFNQSGWPRRLEVTCPGERRRGKGRKEEVRRSVMGGGLARKMGYPGVLAMDSRVRIGPLRPSSCQSVRMDFLAVSPGVHSIDTLTLTDVETGFAMNLRAVMDIVVHDPDD